MIRVRRCVVVVFLVVALFSASCGGSERSVTGVVIDMTGDLTAVEEFVVRLPDGTDQVFEPARGVRFHGGASIGHLRDHLRSGAPVVIYYETLDDGRWIAFEVEDAGE